MTRWFALLGRLLLFGLALAWGCGPPQAAETTLFATALDSLGGVISKTGVDLDASIRAEGTASIRIDAEASTTIRIAEVEPVGAEKVVLTYRARLRSRDLSGKAYLEMWCRVPGKGEFFSRGLQSPLTGTSEWVSEETPCFLEEGQRADLVKLNVVVEGTGTVWVDDVRLVSSPR